MIAAWIMGRGCGRLFLDLDGAAEDRLHAAEPPELTIVAKSSGLVLSSVKAGLHLISVGRGVRPVLPPPVPRACRRKAGGDDPAQFRNSNGKHREMED